MNADSPVISVLIPCFNVAEFIDETLQSVIVQTEPDFEVLLLDDGSTDDTLANLNHWQQMDSRVKVISHSGNRGIIAARNTLLVTARGKYLAWIDADDIAREDRFALQKEFLDIHNDHTAVTCEYVEFSSTQEIYRSRQPRDVSRDALLFYNYILNPGSMVRREIVARNKIAFDTTLAGASDYQFWVDVSRHGPIGVIHEPLMRYRRHDNQESTAQIGRQLKGCQQIVLRQLSELGVEGASEGDMAFFLIYPADILRLPYSSATMKKSCQIANQLLPLLPDEKFGPYAVDLVRHLLRRHAVRLGTSGLIQYIRAVGLKSFLQGRYLGMVLVCDCIRKKY